MKTTRRSIDCHHSCKGICTGLEVAATSEKEGIAVLEAFRDQCTFPEIREMVTLLIFKRREMLKLVEETRTRVREQFDVLEQIQSGFDSKA